MDNEHDDMQDFKGTSGDWYVTAQPIDEGTYTALEIGAKDSICWVAKVLLGAPDPRFAPGECEANARLIAAAPVLLNAAMCARDQMDCFADVDTLQPDKCNHCLLVTAINAALTE